MDALARYDLLIVKDLRNSVDSGSATTKMSPSAKIQLLGLELSLLLAGRRFESASALQLQTVILHATNLTIPVGVLYSSLWQLQRKRFLVSFFAPRRAGIRGVHARRIFQLTPLGTTELQSALDALHNLVTKTLP